jgi:moderate conductance mechanosensitive channel
MPEEAPAGSWVGLPSVLAFLVQEEAAVLDPELADACGDQPTLICRLIFEWTGNTRTAEIADVVLATPAKILLILLIAWGVNRIVQRSIARFTASLGGEQPANRRLKRRIRQSKLGHKLPVGVLDTGVASLRSAARAQTIGLVLRSVATAIIWSIAAITVLGEIGINLGPIIAGAGIAGVALGFGAQSLVKDFLSGIFMLIEDQYGVGDIIDVGEATGTVEAVSLRTTKLRDVNGVMWHVPNGEIARVGNMSQQWARALLDISVAYDTDLDHASEIIQRTADDLYEDPDWRHHMFAEPELWGVQELGADGIDIRLVIKTRPASQWAVMRELRRRLKYAFDEAGIEIPFPQRTIWVRRDPGTSAEPPAGDGGELE